MKEKRLIHPMHEDSYSFEEYYELEDKLEKEIYERDVLIARLREEIKQLRLESI